MNPYQSPQAELTKTTRPRIVIRWVALIGGIMLGIFCLDRFYTYETIIKMAYVCQDKGILTVCDESGQVFKLNANRPWELSLVPIAVLEHRGAWSHIVWTRTVLGDKVPQNLLDQAVMPIEKEINDRFNGGRGW
jgi:hypothetical protein